MKVSELIENLKGMPQDLEATALLLGDEGEDEARSYPIRGVETVTGLDADDNEVELVLLVV